jgi:hypothetical protein
MIRQEAVLENMEHAMEYSVSHNALPFLTGRDTGRHLLLCRDSQKALATCTCSVSEPGSFIDERSES